MRKLSHNEHEDEHFNQTYSISNEQSRFTNELWIKFSERNPEESKNRLLNTLSPFPLVDKSWTQPNLYCLNTWRKHIISAEISELNDGENNR